MAIVKTKPTSAGRRHLVKVVNPDKYPQLCALQNCFVRGSVVRYIQIPPEHVDTELLQDAARKENAPAK